MPQPTGKNEFSPQFAYLSKHPGPTLKAGSGNLIKDYIDRRENLQVMDIDIPQMGDIFILC
jgi:hypothetical protein